METRELVRQLSGAYYVADRAYHTTLPAEVLPWYVYLSDCGHNIVCVLESDYQPGEDLTKFLLPVPVKAALRGYRMASGYVVVNIPYSDREGLLISDRDDEF